MPSTYSPNLRLELIGAGEQAGTWGTTTNTNLGTLVEQAISGRAAVVMANADYTLSTASGASDEARAAILVVTSSVPLTTTRTINCPAVPKMYVVRNATTGAQSIIISAGGAGTVTVSSGTSAAVYCDGTDVRLATDFPSTFSVGMIMMWSGSILTIPVGWRLCDGTGGTPDLRDRFVVGAGGAYAVNATGGANTVTLSTGEIPSHTHTFSANTGGQSVNHTHTYSGSTGGAGAHNHTWPIYSETNSVGGNPAGTGNVSQTTTGTTSTVGDHAHSFSGTTSGFSADHFHGVSGTTAATGSSGAHENRPPYYALAYIMKI